MSIMNCNYNFISNNVNGIEASEKRLKLFEYLKNNINDNGFIFLRETYLLSNDELKWKDEFGGSLFFSHGKNNSCGVAIGYCGKEDFKVVNTACNKNGQILILDAKLSGTNFFLINFYNSGNFYNWKLIYRIPCIATLETKICIFQYKLLNNMLYLNKKLFQFCIISQSKCSFCELYDETPHHIFYECTYTQNLWNQL